MVPVFFGVTLIVFLMLHLAPGDPVALIVGEQAPPAAYQAVREELGLDKPLAEQYALFLKRLASGNLGRSYLRNRDVSELVGEALPVTLELSLAGLLVEFLIGLPIGIMAATKRNSFADQASMVAAIAAVCVPTFWLGLLMINVFGLRLGWFPTSGYGGWRELVLPALTLGLGGAALTTRMARSSMLDVIGQDYVRTARASGLGERLVVWKYGLKNALIPIITLLGLRLGWVVGGSISLEIVFSRPGVGRLMVGSILSRDYPVVEGITLILALCIMAGNLIADLLNALVDPRVRLR